MKTLLRSLLCFALLLGATPALAAKKAKAKAKGKAAASRQAASAGEEDDEPKSKSKKKGKQDLKFSGFKLKGDLKKPDLSYIYKRRGVRDEQIVNIPTDFADEIRQGENQF